MSRRARTRTSFLAIGLFFLAVPLWLGSRSLGGGGGAGGGGNEPFLVPPDFQVKLLRSGLGADALAAAGVSSLTITSTLQAAADELNAHPTTLTAADTAFAAARVESDRLRAKIQAGQATQEEISSYQTQMSNLATARSSRLAALDAVFNAATANLSEGQRATLTQIRANRAVDHSQGFPIEFQVANRTEAQWVALRDALANEEQAIKYPDTLDQDAQTLLSTTRAEGAVAAARTALDANLPAVQTAWNTAAGTGQ